MPRTELTTEQRKAFENDLKKFGIPPDRVVANITPETHPGPVTLSADPKTSTIPPVMLSVNSVDEVKRLAGHPDAEFEDGTREDVMNGAELPDWPEELNDADPSELTPEQNRQIEQASRAYIYGHSGKVQSYKSIIEKHKFPTKLATFAAENVCIDSSNSPFVIDSDSGHVYGTMTICASGTLKFEANATMSVQNLIKSNDDTCGGN